MAAPTSAATRSTQEIVRPPNGNTPQLIVALVATILFIALHWRGIPLSPDGWSYWQAAVSIANGTGYRNFEGTPILAWPPLYSLFLSAWVSVCGPSGATLVVANGSLIVVQALLWHKTLITIWKRDVDLLASWQRSLIALYIGIFVPLTLQAALSENLSYIFFAAMTISTWQVISAVDKRDQLIWLSTFVAGATLGLLSHNIMLAASLACVIVMIRFGRPSTSNFVLIALATVVPLCFWWCVRRWLGQTHSHVVDFSASSFDTLQYITQMGFSVGNLIVPNLFGAPTIVSVALAILLFRDASKHDSSQGARPETFVAMVILLSCTQILVLFNLTRIADPIGARFVACIPILLVPALMVRLSKWGPKLYFALAVIALAPNTHRAVLFSILHPQAYVANQVTVLFPINAYISPEYLVGPPQQTAQGLLVAPPTKLQVR